MVIYSWQSLCYIATSMYIIFAEFSSEYMYSHAIGGKIQHCEQFHSIVAVHTNNTVKV